MVARSSSRCAQADVGGGEQVGPAAARRPRAGARPRPRCDAVLRSTASSPSSSAIRAACCPDRRASPVSPRHAARKACRARAKPERPRVVGAGEDLDRRPRRAARRARDRRRTRRSRRARCARRRPRRVSPSSRRSSSACSRAAIASRSRSVRYSSSDSASSRPARAAASSPVCAARSRRTRRPPGAPRTGTPRPPRPARTRRIRATSPAAAAWWASTLGVAADRLQRVDHRRVQRRFGAGRGRAPGRPDRAISCRNATPRPVPVDQAGGGQHPDRRRRHVRARRAARRPTGSGRARQQFEAVPGRRGQPGDAGEHGVADALGQRGVRLGEDLADEERVARGAAVHARRGRARARRGASATAAPAQRGQLQPARVGRRRRGRRAPGRSGWSTPSASR